MADANRYVEIRVTLNDKDARAGISNLYKEVQNIGKAGKTAAQELKKSLGSELKATAEKSAKDLTRDFSKAAKEGFEKAGEKAAKEFGQSLRKSLTPQLTQLKKDIQDATKGAGESSSSLPSSSGGLGGSLPSLASGVYLAKQAYQGFQQIVELTNQTLERGQQVTNLTAAFETMQNSVGRTNNAIEQLRNSTSGLINDFDLMQSANLAVTLGVDNGSESFLKLTEGAVKLGRALNLDAKASLDSLVVGIGRQSRLVLDNLGIIVKAEEAYQKFAASVHKSVDELTIQEERLAFTKAATEAVINTSAGLPPILINAGEAQTKLQNATQGVIDKFVKQINENKGLSDALQEMAKIIGGLDLEGFADAIAFVATKFIEFANVILSYVIPAITQVSTAIVNAEYGFGFFLRTARNLGEGGGLLKAMRDAAKETSYIAEGAKEASKQFEGLRESIKNATKIDQLTGLAGQVKAQKEALGSIDVSGEGGNSKAVLISQQLAELSKIQGELILKTAQVERALESTGETGSEEMKKLAREAKEAKEQLGDLLLTLTTGEPSKFSAELNEAARAAFFSGQGNQELAASILKIKDAYNVTDKDIKEFTSASKESAKLIDDLTKQYDKFDAELQSMLGFESYSKNLQESIIKSTELFNLYDKGDLSAEDFNISVVELAKSFGLEGKEIEELIKHLKALQDQSQKTKEEIDKFQKEINETLVGRAAGFANDIFGTSFFQIPEGATAEQASKITEQANKLSQQLGNEIFDTLNGTGVINQILDGLKDEKFTLGKDGDIFGLAASITNQKSNEDKAQRVVEQVGAAVLNAYIPGLGSALDKFLQDTGVGDQLWKAHKKYDKKILKYGTGGVGYAAVTGLEAAGLGWVASPAKIIEKMFYETPGTTARKAFKKFMNRLISDSGFDLSLSFSPDQKSFKVPKNFFREIEDGFGNVTTQAQIELEKLQIPDKLYSQFLDLGTTLGGLLYGFDSEFLGQFGQLLAFNFQTPEGLNELQLILEAAGVSAEQLTQKLEEAYFKGDLSAQKFLSTLASTRDLTAEGIPGVEGLEGIAIAWQNIVDKTLISGQHAADGFKDLIVEAADAGITDFAGLKDYLLTLFPADQVTAFFNTLQTQGIDTFEKLKALTPEGFANLTVGLQNAGFAFKEIGKDVDETIEKIEKFKATAEQDVVTNYRVNVEVTGDELPPGFTASGGEDPRERFNSGPALQ